MGIVEAGHSVQDAFHDAAMWDSAKAEVNVFVIAGASGRTGGVVAETLLAQGKKVRVLVRDARKGETWRERGADVAVTPLEDGQGLERALAGAMGFFTLLPEDPTVQDFGAHRCRIADAIGAAVKGSRVPHVVLLSTTAAFLPDGNGPAKELHYLEKVLRDTGTRLTAIRACYLQENVLMAVPAAQHQAIYPNFLPSADVAFPTVATRDVGKLVARCLVEPPSKSEVIDLLGPAYSVRQFADKLGTALGRNLSIVDVPAAAHVQTLTMAGVPKQVAETLAEMFACVASGRVSPKGDRRVSGSTTIDEILPGLLVTRPSEEGKTP